MRRPVRQRVLLLLGLTALAAAAACVDREAAVARHMDQAASYLEAGNLDKARVELRNAARLDPQNARARFELGQIAEQKQAWRRAFQMYQSALLIDASLVEANVALAALMLRFNETGRAAEYLDQALAAAPGDAEALALQAWVALRGGDRAGAMSLVDRSLAADPGTLTAISLKSELLLEAGESDAALSLLEQAVEAVPEDTQRLRLLVRALAGLGRIDEAMARQERLIALAPEDLEHYVGLAELQVAAGEGGQAVEVLARALETLGVAETADVLVELVVRRFPAEALDGTLEQLTARFPDAHAFALALAARHERAGRLAMGRALLDEVITRASALPVELEARTQLARLHLIAGEDAAAAEEVDRVLARNPRDVDALILRARLARDAGDAQAAARDLRLALGAGERVAELRRMLAEVHVETGELALAVESMQAAVEVAPNDARYRLALVQLALRTNDLALARAEIDTLLEADAVSPTLYELAFHVFEQSGDLDRAATLADRLATDYPGEAAGHYLKGRLAHLAGDFDAARSAYERALEQDGDLTQVLDGLVRVLLASGAPEDALARVDEALARTPERRELALLRADALDAAGRSQEAETAYETLTGSHPTWPAPWSRLAARQHAAGRAQSAEASLRAGLEATGWHAALGEQLAMLLLEEDHPDEAIEVFERLHEQHPELDAVANNLAMLLVTHRDTPADIARAGRLVDPYADSLNPSYLDTVGWVRLRQGRVAEALELLQEAVRAAPGRPTQRYHLAVAYLESGDERAARRELDVALASAAPFPEREVARRWRERLAAAPAEDSGR